MNQTTGRNTDSEFDLLSCISMCVGVCVSRSAKEAEEKIKKALDKGEVLPTEARFDSNCITPGKDRLRLLSHIGGCSETGTISLPG